MEGWEAKSSAPSFLSVSGRQSCSEAGAVLVQSSLEVPGCIRGSHPLPVPCLYQILGRVFSLPPSEQRLVPELAVQVEAISSHV